MNQRPSPLKTGNVLLFLAILMAAGATILMAAGATILMAAGATAVTAYIGTRPPPQSQPWVETAWQMPLDNWGQGRAWRARTAGGTGILLLARTKTGFCNCFGGIADDSEIDRIGDVDLHGDTFAPTAPGEPAAIGPLLGRKRAFRAGGNHVVSMVAASGCKAVVATLVSKDPIPAGAEASATTLLAGDSFRQWAENQ